MTDNTDEKERRREAGTVKENTARSRIARAGQRIRAEATRALAKEKPPRRRPLARQEAPPPEYPLLKGLSELERSTLVEVADEQGRPLLCMPPEQAMRRGLCLELVLAALRGPQGKILLRRRSDGRLPGLGRWDLHIGFVLVGETGEDAACRVLAVETGLEGLRPVWAAQVACGSAGRSGAGGAVHAGRTLFIAELPRGLYPSAGGQEQLAVDADELEGLVRQVPDLLTAELQWAAGTGLLFRR